MLPLSAAQPTGSATTRLESPCAASTYPAYVFGVGVFTWLGLGLGLGLG